MAQNQISITTGVTTHENVLSDMNANFSDAETRFSSLELISGDSLVSGDNVSLLTNDAGYITDGVQSGDNISLLVNDENYVSSGDNVSLLTNDVGYITSTQQSISSVSSGVTLDNSLGGNADITLTEDVTGLSIINSTSGDNGLIIVKQDNTAGWTFTSTYDVLAGDLADIASITPSGSGAASIGWYDDGSDYYLYVSNFT